MAEKEILTTFEAAKLCRVSYNTVKNWIKRDLISAYRTVGGHLRIKTSEFETFCRKQGIPLGEAMKAVPRRLLVIEAEEMANSVIKSVIQQYPEELNVHNACDGFGAGAAIEAIKPDVILLDHKVDGVDAARVCEYVRCNLSLQHAKIVLFVESAEKAKSACADVFLEKPVEREKLVSALNSLLKPHSGVRKRGNELK